MVRALDLKDRGIVSISGSDGTAFLNGLITNDVVKASENEGLYAALLTPQGKYLFDFFVLRRGEEILLDADRSRVPELIKRLTVYKLRAKLALADRSPEFRVAAFDGPVELDGAFPDPRHPALGFRAILNSSFALDGFEPWPREDYRRLLLDHLVPDHERDLVPNETFPMDVQFDRLNGIDFRKGCYVGQELTARMKHRANQRKALVRVRVEGTLPPPGTPIMAEDKEAGVLASGIGDRALAVLRLDRLDQPLVVSNRPITVER